MAPPSWKRKLDTLTEMVQSMETSEGEPIVGAAGPAGPPGAPGDRGPAGEDGVAGERGYQGVPGPAGPAGPVGPPGPTGERGPTGLTGPAGQTGAAGVAGQTGSTGATGPAGPSVKLCAGTAVLPVLALGASADVTVPWDTTLTSAPTSTRIAVIEGLSALTNISIKSVSKASCVVTLTAPVLIAANTARVRVLATYVEG